MKARALEIHFKGRAEREEETGTDKAGDVTPTITATVPWSLAKFAAVKGILHSPSPRTTMSLATREALLSAVAKARTWIDDLVEGRVRSFSEIAKREGKVERHIRLLAPLAFASPRIISEIVDGFAAFELTVTNFTKRLAYSWAEQENCRSQRSTGRSARHPAAPISAESAASSSP
jgi:hypothetical protein